VCKLKNLNNKDGIFGSLIVRQSKYDDVNSNLYDYDLSDHVIIVNDWAHMSSASWNAEFRQSDGYILGKTILINGKGKPSAENPTSTETPLAKFSVKLNQRYRFRLIDIGVYYCPKRFSVDGHNLTIIALDGHLIEPVEVESIVTQPGMRYDFVLNTNKEPMNYFIKVKGIVDVCDIFKTFQLAELNYEKATNKLNISTVNFDTAERAGKVTKFLILF